MQDGLRNVHSSMIQRCENPKRQQYSRYGGRGIKVCEEWHNREIKGRWSRWMKKIIAIVIIMTIHTNISIA